MIYEDNNMDQSLTVHLNLLVILSDESIGLPLSHRRSGCLVRNNAVVQSGSGQTIIDVSVLSWTSVLNITDSLDILCLLFLSIY